MSPDPEGGLKGSGYFQCFLGGEIFITEVTGDGFVSHAPCTNIEAVGKMRVGLESLNPAKIGQ